MNKFSSRRANPCDEDAEGVVGSASALALLVARVLADDHDPTVTADHPALVADLLDARLDLHGIEVLRVSATTPPKRDTGKIYL
jgi:hypothetical protein